MFRKSPFSIWAIALGLLSTVSIGKAEAALFDQEEVEQESYIAIAVPLPQGGRYNLIVIEQKSDSRLCWEETEEAGVVDPLLLNFNFTGICGRSTDSNGYSIRQVGEDLALKYRLSLQKKDGFLALMGVPLQNAFGKPIEIGRTETLTDGYLKINLNPDWKFTRRSYQGKVLGHVYFTRDVLPPEPIAEEEPEEVLEETVTIESTEPEEAVSQDNPQVEESAETPTFESQDGLPAWPPTELPETTTNSEPVTPKTGSPSQVSPLEGPVQIPVPIPQSSQSFPSSGGQLNTIRPVTQLPNVSQVAAAPGTPIPVPSIAPLGRVGASEPDVFSTRDLARLPKVSAADGGSPPPPAFSVAYSIRRYRVFVDASQNPQSDAIKSIAPDAFWTRHQGRRVLQLGSFLEKSKADLMLQALGQQGISAIIDAAQY